MLQKWKDIIANWINCYFIESDKKEKRVTLESLLNIISHLRENLSLDESKSSILDAHTVEEFVREKYPDFQFNNGSVEASSEDETYIVASLLLYFVCVNSKDLDIKHAMCSQLSSEDQEIILKFSKCLMECAPVTYKDIQAAITEACGQDSSAIGPSSLNLVPETPPALRSLHGEVRRLQAALDAERFDRNYLQEELARTNLRVEKFAKDKEQYILEIVNLKAKISMCCGQEKDARAGDAATEGTAKLMRELEETEERLVRTQGQLDDAQYERDTYKAKINELKQERDKWLGASQQEAARASQLCSELEAERRRAHSLAELVAELRQHHQLNRLDSSQLECDDPDASIHSLHHNMSVCSEACANVVEVQLGEERAKIVVLKQQIQSLQDQLNDLTQKTETEKQSLEKIISERENDIFNLKHRINEEIEEKNNMTIHFSDAMSKLNNEINELEQKLKDNNHQSRMVVETKMQEIQTLQEEKLSLLQSLTDETNKLENIIKNLKSELDSEKTFRVKMRDEYENHIMKLNEKVLNRNNELVEMQNDVFEKSDKIEALHLELRKEKQARDELVEKHHDECEQMTKKLLECENTIKHKCNEIAKLTERLNYNFEIIKELGCEVDELKYALSEQNKNCKVLEGTKITMLEELQMKEKKVEELHKYLENMENVHSEEKDKLEKDLDEAAATVNALQMQLHGELQFKIGLQDDYAQLEHTKTLLSKEVEILREELNKVQDEILQKDKTIAEINLFLQKEKHINVKVKQECQNLKDKIKKISENVTLKNNKIKAIKNELAEARKKFAEELRVKHDNIESVNQKLHSVIEEKKALEIKCDHAIKERDFISKELCEKVNEMLKLKDRINDLENIIEYHKTSSKDLQSELKQEKQARDELVAKHRDECEKMNEKLLECENKIQLQCGEIAKLTEILNELKNAVSEQSKNYKILEKTKTTILEELQIENKKVEELHKHLETIENVHSREKYELEKKMAEAAATVNALQVQLQGDHQFKVGLQADYAQIEQTKTLLSKKVDTLKEEVNKLQNQIKHKDKTIVGMDLCLQEENLTNKKVKQECQNLNEKILKLSGDIVVKNNQIKAIENEHAEARKTFAEELSVKQDNIESVNKKLLGVIEEKKALEIKCDHVSKERDSISYELSEKVKEILELHEKNNAFDKIIENNKKSSQALDLELKKEKQARDELVAMHHDECDQMNEKLLKSEIEIKLKCDEITKLTERLNYNFEFIKELGREVDELKDSVSEQSENCKVLEGTKLSMLKELQMKDKKVEEIKKHLETIENVHSEEKDKLEKKLKETAATVNTLQMQLQGELQFKVGLHNDYAQMEQTKTLLSKDVEILREEVNELQNEIQHKDKTIEEFDLCLQEEKLTNDRLKQECQNLKNEIRKLSEDMVVKYNEIKAIENDHAEARKTFAEELSAKQEHIESVDQKLLSVIEEKKALEIQYDLVVKERDSISNELSVKVHEILKLQEKNNDLDKIIEHYKISSQDLQSELKHEKQAKDELVAKHHDECKQMNKKLLKSENIIKLKCNEIAKLTEILNELKHALVEQSKNCKVLEGTKTTMFEELQMKDKKVQELLKHLETIENVHSREKYELEKKLEEAAATVNALQLQLHGELQCKVSLQDNYALVEQTNTLLSKEVATLKQEVIELQNEIQHKAKTIEEIDLSLQEEKLTNENVKQECQNLNNKIMKLSEDIVVKNNEIIAIGDEFAKAKKTFAEELRVKHDNIESVNQKLLCVVEENKALEIKCDHAIKERDSLNNELSKKIEEILKLQEKNNDLDKIIRNNKKSSQDLQSELNLEKQARDELVAKHHDECEHMNEKLLKSENIIKLKCDEIAKLTKRLNELKNAVSEQSENCKVLEGTKITTLKELQMKDKKVEDLYKNLKTIENVHSEEKYELEKKLDTAAATVNALQMQLQEELRFKVGLQNEYAQVKQTKTLLSKEVDILREEVNKLQKEIHMKDKTIEQKDLCFQKEKQECQNLNDEIRKLSEDVVVKNNEIKTIENELSEARKTFTEELRVKLDNIESVSQKLSCVIEEKKALGIQYDHVVKERDSMSKELSEKVEELLKIQEENNEMKKVIENHNKLAVAVSEKTGSHKNTGHFEKEYREFHHQVDSTTSDLTHSSMESINTISDLEKIIHDKNRTITSLQCDITYLKSLIADSENKLLDVSKELEISKENCHQLSSQLKKIVYQKNEEIAELKRQVNKMSVTENRASQIIKVSAKYQAIILKRIAEIKSNTVLKELTNFGNSANGDNELRRSLNAGSVTIEDLENFLETTDKHLKRCSEKQVALQKERDRLMEVNRINDSEIINLKKFLTELSVSFKTFSTVKDLYAQKFSRVVSVQRTVRREILSLDGHITDATMCKLERGYAAAMQDLSECVMNMERWVERCIGRTISPEKIKQAFTNDEDRASFVSTTFQNTSLEVQLEELDNSFQKLLEEVVRAQKGEGARDAQSVTVMEVRAEYEDKLNRMKAKMKQLYQEQISVYKEKQHSEVLALERELAKTRERLAESSKAYEEHIRSLTAELWNVGEKFLSKKDEVDWLKKKQRSGSLMSLQHVHSSGLVPPPEEPSRPSDTHSLRSLPVHNSTNSNKRDKEGRALHMSDEEGEVFDNRWLKELASTPRRAPAAPPRDSGLRLSELRWRNSLCPPHLKSSYPAETQFQPVLDEEDIKFSLGNTSSLSARPQRKEVGITAYKKPGPPTPSKNAGRLSATDSELRESLRVEAEPQPSRKTSTPSRLRALFRSSKNDTAEGTPRSRRLSIFRKK